MLTTIVITSAVMPIGCSTTLKAHTSATMNHTQTNDTPEIVVNWARVASVDDFFDSVFPQCESPSWHGRNLDALADSWVTGGINQKGPPYAFVFLAIDATPPALTAFRDAVLKIAQESIDVNGGRLVQSGEQTIDDIPRSN